MQKRASKKKVKKTAVKRAAKKVARTRAVRKKTGSLEQRSLTLHHKHQGKLEVRSKMPLTKETLEQVYTPGVASVCRLIAKDTRLANEYTMKGRTIAVVTNGTALLGLGDVGPVASLPVMEGKAMLFKELAGIDAVPLVLNAKDINVFVETVKALAPGFAGINLEDIAAPSCFPIEERLKSELDVPVMHDDQHGTAVVVLAALLNAHTVVQKDIAHSRIAIVGAGAAGTAIAKLLFQYGIGDIVLVDHKGILHPGRTDIGPEKEELVQITNLERRMGGVLEALTGADVVIGVSRGRTIAPDHVRMMAQRPIVFALANPEPEIYPEEALAAGAAVVATGRSDFPNQVNNVLVFPGMFKGALTHNVKRFTDSMKMEAARELARLIRHPSKNKILPSVFDKRVVPAVARAIHR